ncbi:hypothetical protein RHMOL_Rhmol11G0202700 [Rhododendron molle]|uniref:Uncharacterized protein n=1 Tax=Rhododendron molle TaxID=49168 RepID=A0ACC0LUN0_RHOML|nr:hypothetical protein RHMOL_Rhmol11G0202700 [Rhododendron molle]
MTYTLQIERSCFVYRPVGDLYPSDGCMSFTVEAAEELGVPQVLFWTTSACGFLGYTMYKDLVEEVG